MQQTAFELKYEMLCERTHHRQRAAKADLERRRVAPRVSRASNSNTVPRWSQATRRPVTAIDASFSRRRDCKPPRLSKQ
jgi:hypothetical protein